MRYSVILLFLLALSALSSCNVSGAAAVFAEGQPAEAPPSVSEALAAEPEPAILSDTGPASAVVSGSEASLTEERAAEEPLRETAAELPAGDPASTELSSFESSAPEFPASPPAREPVDYETVQPNEAGDIPIIMYHGIDAEKPGRYDRKTSDFIGDLEALYDGGFRLVSLTDALSGNIDVPAGYSPAVLTFDDAKRSSFSLREKDGRLVPAEGCAVDILERFNEDHPGFGTAAVFFIIGCDEPFRGSGGTVAERLKYLTDNGYEIGNHTYSHSSLGRKNAARLQEEFGLTEELLLSIDPRLELNAVAYPGGVSPAENLLGYVLNGEYGGKEYENRWGLRCAPGKTSANPFRVNFDPVNVPRLRPTDDSTNGYAVLDLWYFLRKYEKEPWHKFISDGRPETVAVHKDWEPLINRDALGERELVVWGE